MRTLPSLGPRRTRRADRGPRVAVIGAGFSGVTAGYYLRRAGIEDFVIFERGDSVGGTWWYNRYPGAAVDTWSHLYSFSFFHGDFSRTHVAQQELHRYIESAVDHLGLRPHIRLATAVAQATWDDARREYEVRFSGGGSGRYDHVISAVGMFSEPSVPAGLQFTSFTGEVYHSARWPRDADLRGKRVAVIGTGSTAAQIVPAIAPDAAKVYVFQRQPNWVLPKNDRAFSGAERQRYRSWWRHRLRRYQLYWASERSLGNGRMFRPGTKHNAAMERVARNHLASALSDRPDLLERLTPRYPVTGKRPVVSSDWYHALKLGHVHLVDSAIAKVATDTVVDDRGEEYPVDVIIQATGFTANQYLATLSVKGRRGLDLHACWGDEPQTTLGVMVSGFPNFYLLYGPNTNGTTILSNLERQAKFAVWQIRHSARRHRAAEARPWVQKRLSDLVQRGCEKTAWTQATGYFVNSRGVVVTQWPYGVTTYGLMLVAARRLAVRRTRR